MRAKILADPTLLYEFRYPEGFHYNEEFLTPNAENDLLQIISTLDFRAFDFHGYIARRRIVEYGFEYDFGSRRASATQPIPDFLRNLKDRSAAWAGISPEQIVESVITEYPPGAPIGWHRDVPQFEIIIGISLRTACRMRFKPYQEKGKLVSIPLEPRSIYRMEGPARWDYQHSIPAVKELRYSITFRTPRQTRNRTPG